MKIEIEKLNGALDDLFAPWVQSLGLQIESADHASVTLRLPHNVELSRVGGVLCGQAMMAAADTAMVLALINHFGEFKPCTTVQMSSSFLKPLANVDALVTARLSRVGKSMAFGEITLRDAASGTPVFTATTVYALLAS